MRSARPRPRGEGAEEALEASLGLKHRRNDPDPGRGPGPPPAETPPSAAPGMKRSAAKSSRTLAEKTGVRPRPAWGTAGTPIRWDPHAPRGQRPSAAILRPGALTCRAPCVAPPPAPAPRARGGRAGAAAQRRGGGGDKAPGNEWDGPARPFLLTPSGPAGRRQRRPPVSPAAAARGGEWHCSGTGRAPGWAVRLSGPAPPLPLPCPPPPRLASAASVPCAARDLRPGPGGALSLAGTPAGQHR